MIERIDARAKVRTVEEGTRRDESRKEEKEPGW